MKNIKNILLGIMISFLIFVIYGIITYVVQMNQKLDFDTNLDYEKIMNENYFSITKLKSQNLSENDRLCVSKIEKLYDYSLETYSTGEIKLTDYFKKLYNPDLESPLAYYSQIFTSCDALKQANEKSNEVNRIFSQSRFLFSFREAEYEKHLSSYEIHVIDKVMKVDGNSALKLAYFEYYTLEGYLIKDMIQQIGGKYEEGI